MFSIFVTVISILDHIQYLIMRHDCVVVPGLGAFVAQNEAAYRAADGRWMPPARVVGFNAGVGHDDGILCAGVARREGISYEAAKTVVANDVALLRQRMGMTGSVMLPRLGSFNVHDGIITFEPCGSEAVAGAMYMGLRPAGQASESVSEPTGILDVPFTTQRRTRSWIKIAASAAVLLGLGLTLSTPIAVDRSAMQYASVASIATPAAIDDAAATAAEEVRTLYCIIPNPADGKSSVLAKADKPSVVKDARAAAVKSGANDKKSLVDKVQDGYHYLIVASCESLQRAERFVAEHPGQGLRILPSEGRYRVYKNRSTSRDNAMAQRESVIATYPGAWVYSCE
ncbi:MAG: hypothetical protein NC043_04690 [Muribaculaceae bacterium]|nr:hypothetical protein [Muribaculaceae bacterium]